MGFHRNPVYFPSSFQDFTSYQDPEEEMAPAPTTNQWEEMELDESGWNARLPVDLQIESTAPHFFEVPQVPQIPTLYAPPEALSPYPNQQPAGPSYEANSNDPNGGVDVAIGALLDAMQGDQTQAQHQLSARRKCKDPAKRRELTLKKRTHMDALRQTLGVSPGTTKKGTLNTAIERLGGHTARTEALAYVELHRLTSRQGRLKHLKCLKAANDALKARHPGDEIPHV